VSTRRRLLGSCCTAFVLKNLRRRPAFPQSNLEQHHEGAAALLLRASPSPEHCAGGGCERAEVAQEDDASDLPSARERQLLPWPTGGGEPGRHDRLKQWWRKGDAGDGSGGTEQRWCGRLERRSPVGTTEASGQRVERGALGGGGPGSRAFSSARFGLTGVRPARIPIGWFMSLDSLIRRLES